jgi:hypothetical protein
MSEPPKVWGEGLLDNEYACEVVHGVVDTVVEYLISLEREPVNEATSAVVAAAVSVLLRVSPSTVMKIEKTLGKAKWTRAHDQRAAKIAKIVKRHASGFKKLKPDARRVLTEVAANAPPAKLPSIAVLNAMTAHRAGRAFVRELAHQVAAAVDEALVDDDSSFGALYMSGALGHVAVLAAMNARDVPREKIATWRRAFAAKYREFRRDLTARGGKPGFESAYAKNTITVFDRLVSKPKRSSSRR